MPITPDIPAGTILPSVNTVLRAQGIPDSVTPPDTTITLAENAITTCRELATPRGILADIPIDNFRPVFEGEGKNDSPTPLANIYNRSTSLALFAVTLGDDLCREISRLFDSHHYAEGAMLDSAASETAELAARFVEQHYRESLRRGDRLGPGMTTTPFSPGYCGWHISAQKKLFSILNPESIGITLTDSCLMQPLKSVTGVIVAGKNDIFVFDDSFEFCDRCTTHSCRDRIKSMSEEQ